MICEQLRGEIEFYLEEAQVRVTRAWVNWWLLPWFTGGLWSGYLA